MVIRWGDGDPCQAVRVTGQSRREKLNSEEQKGTTVQTMVILCHTPNMSHAGIFFKFYKLDKGEVGNTILNT